MAETTRSPAVELAERVARLARELGIETALIGAAALAVHHYVRASADLDLATYVDLGALRSLQSRLESEQLHTDLRVPDEQDVLGGVLEIWNRVDDQGEPVEP